jgi:hypothetical protein
VRQRYGRPDDVPDYEYAVVFPPLIQQYKSLSCLIYQCSEGSVPETVLYQQMLRRKIDLACEIIGHLEEYDRADWD